MEKKKRLYREITWFFCSVAAGLLLSILLYRIIKVNLNTIVLVVGVIVTLLAVYVVRLTLWVLKESL